MCIYKSRIFRQFMEFMVHVDGLPIPDYFKGDIPLKGFLGKAARGEPEVVGTG